MAPQPGANNGSQSQLLGLNNSLMTKLKPSRIFKTSVDNPPPAPALPGNRPPQGPRHITGITFDDRGDTLVTAAEDETFRLYNCKTGKYIKTLKSQKYGIDLPRYTHKSTTILHASTKEDDSIRYHSLHDNKYLSYFKGHKGRVISLEVSPVDDGFMSGSTDKTVRLWDLRAPVCRGLLNLPASPVVAYDSSGLVFAVAVNYYQRILLYDQANYDKAPFLTITLDDPSLALISYPPRPIYITSLSFSSNGKYLLVGASGDNHYILDAFGGHPLAKLEGHIGLERRSMTAPQTIEPSKGCSGEEVSWTPDSKYIVGGSLDGKVIVWDIQNLPAPPSDDAPPKPVGKGPPKISPLVKLDGHPGPSRCVKFNPRLAMMATAGSELAFWLPDTSADVDEIAREMLKKKAPSV
ncbi:wd repeat-containing protein 82 [Moniliophthora roreri MCA 2997]|uniref:Wd repeat-containing protein 82 n=1 Tax=Moniliophthora roreri (strain MCA 2997) TaxID=1381753 RepID=V2XII0_MONRO|nr:wd repeat-containing protein 82 [Moniliophthora roreri MCA 2997]